MDRLKQWVLRVSGVGIACAFLLGAAAESHADPISFHLSSTLVTSASGSTVTIDGTVTNNSGGNLNASDFFFNFFGYDPTSVNPIQDLGVTADFLIPNGATSATVALFDVALGTVPAASSFPIEVLLEDINNDASSTQTVTVSVPISVPAPEPSTRLLLAAVVFSLLLTKVIRKFGLA